MALLLSWWWDNNWRDAMLGFSAALLVLSLFLLATEGSEGGHGDGAWRGSSGSSLGPPGLLGQGQGLGQGRMHYGGQYREYQALEAEG